MSNVIYYQNVLNRKMKTSIKYLGKGEKTPDKLQKQIDTLTNWYTNEIGSGD